MHKQYTLYNREVHKNTIKWKAKNASSRREAHGRTGMAEVLVPDQFHRP
jgi:hypothetical protein